jgi:3-carboxy-cis,cis-muconate cycloisomerase
MNKLFAGTYARGRGADELNGEAWLRAMLEVEAALAAASAELGLIAADAAAAIVEAAADPERFDLDAIATAGAEHATPVIPLVQRLRELVGPQHSEAVHLGATSQDILDSAMMLVAKRSLEFTLADAEAARAAAQTLAAAHSSERIVGRTLLQQALPVRFGDKAHRWSVAVGQAGDGLEQVRAALPAQLSGPVGGGNPRVTEQVASRLGLVAPELCWHTDRVPVARLATGAGILCGVLGKIARDVTLLAQTEVGEVAEGVPGRGGSSAMAHKRNPVAAISVLACTKRAPGLVATVLSSMEQEHERAAGAWQSEWGAISELLSLTASASAWSADLLTNLKVDPQRMAANLEGAQT